MLGPRVVLAQGSKARPGVPRRVPAARAQCQWAVDGACDGATCE